MHSSATFNKLFHKTGFDCNIIVTSNECIAGNGWIPERSDTSEYIKEWYKGLVDLKDYKGIKDTKKYVFTCGTQLFSSV